jgi:hypothetical protein
MPDERPPLQSVQSVRAELRRLGYLDSGLDRFVLADAGARSATSASWRAAGRVGMLGGILLGATLALAAAGLDRRLLAEPQDLAVLAAYLALVLGVVTAVLTFAGGLAAGWYARRGARRPGAALSRNVGLALALVAVGYFGLWWRSHATHAPWPVQVLAIALALGLSLALGRFGALAAVAVLSAGGPALLPTASASRRRMLPVVALAALICGAAVAAASWLGARADAAAPDFAVVPTGLRVHVLGLDGLDPRMAEQMMARGELPRLSGLLRRAAWARMRAEPERVPAIVWTTIATGRGPQAHGIQSTDARRLAGMRTPVALSEDGRLARAVAQATDLLRLTRPQPASSVLRAVKAFWNVASEKGLRVGVVNWWATWPADAVNGYVVTERAYFKLEKGGPAEREAFPDEAFARLRNLPRGVQGDRARDLDRFHVQAARLLRGAAPPDLEAVYLSGLDICSMQQLGEATADLATLDARLAAVRDCYRWTDGLLGDVLDSLGEGQVLVLVADPGRLARRGEGAREGLLALAGPPVRAGALPPASERDVAPTVLHLAGLPVSRELEGRVLEEALREEFRRAHPPRTVASYGRRPPGRPAESSFDRDMLEELRSLGYIR